MEEEIQSITVSDAKSNTAQLVASCDSSGVTFVNEDARLNLDENSLVEIAYINITEDMLRSEVESIESVTINDDDSSRQSSEMCDYEENESDEENPRVDEEQLAFTNDFLSGKISFQDFITSVEGPDVLETEEDTSDAEDAPDELQVGQDPDYVPESVKQKSTRVPSKSSKLMDKEFGAYSVENTSGSYCKEFFHSMPTKTVLQRGRKVGTKIARKLPSSLLGLMGEANLRYARNEKEDAINLCMEVIRQAPSYAEPFQALSMFYEDLGEYEKSYQLSLIAAYLSPQDADEWLRLAEVCLSRTDELQASKCLAKAVQADPSNLQIHQSRCELLESMGAHKELLQACLTMLRCVQPHEQKMGEWVELAVRIARMQHASCHLHSARRALSNALVHCSSHFTMEQFNLLFELQILTKRYFDVIKVLNKYCGVAFSTALTDEIDLEEADSMDLTTELPLDILSKLCIALIYCNKMKFAASLIGKFVEADVEEYGDIYLDVAEALSENQHHETSLSLLQVLVHSKSFSMAAVWLKYANCLAVLNRLDEAISSFRYVIRLVPSSEDARISLSELLTKLGRHEEALEAVTQDSEASFIEASILHHRCLLLLKEGHWDQFLAAYKLLMMRHARNIRSKDEVYKACGAKKIGWESEEESADEELEFGSSSVELVEEYRLLRVAADFLFKEGRLIELERICFMALTSPLFRRKRDIHREVQFLTLQVCMAKGDSYYAYNLARSLLLRSNNLFNNRVWNLLIQVIMRGDDVRYNRFLVRLLVKHPEHVCLSVLNGHACVASGTYKYALDEYMSACKLEPNNPFFLLLSSIVLIQLTCQKFSSGKHSLITQASAFFDAYVRTRGDCQEVYYNIGRGMHQLGLLPQALEYYKRALQLPPCVPHLKFFDLSREIAFNLSLIYRSTDAAALDRDVARMYLDKYITL